MNRRALLLGLGATACSPRTTRAPKRPSTEQRAELPAPNRDVSYFQSQRAPSPLVFHAGELLQSTADELRRLDARTRVQRGVVRITHRHFTVLPDGAVALFAFEGRHAHVHRIDADALTSFRGPELATYGAGKTCVLPTPDRDEIYATYADDLLRLRMTSQQTLDEVARFAIPRSRSKPGQLVIMPDGRVVCPAGNGFAVLAPTPANIETRGREPLHLARGPGGRVWYSHGRISSEAHAVALATLDTPSRTELDVDVSPARIVHMSASAGLAAMLTMQIFAFDHMRWDLIVVDDRGERWRAEVPEEFTKPWPSLNLHGFVAISPERVVLRRLDHALLAWDTATGARVQ